MNKSFCCQNLRVSDNLNNMEAVERLEILIRQLLAQHKLLREENERLGKEISVLSREKNVLEEENRNLHESLALQEVLRVEALRRIDGLLRKIRDYEKVE